MSRNNNRNYFEPSNLASVYVSFVRPMINVWEIFTLRSKNELKDSIFTHFRFCQAVVWIEKWSYL